jgi:hypothetical protein
MARNSSNHSHYYAALLRTNHDIVVPTQGKLLNYVRRVPLGVVAQITVCLALIHPGITVIDSNIPALQPSFIDSREEIGPGACSWEQCHCQAIRSLYNNLSYLLRTTLY